MVVFCREMNQPLQITPKAYLVAKGSTFHSTWLLPASTPRHITAANQPVSGAMRNEYFWSNHNANSAAMLHRSVHSAPLIPTMPLLRADSGA